MPAATSFFRYICIISISLLMSISNLTSQDKLRWAADAEGNAPYIFQDPKIPSENIGFEVDIAKALADELGMDPFFVQNQWDGLIPGLYRGDYDMAINGLEITEDRKNEVLFSIPYYLTYEQLVVPKYENDIKSLADLVGKKAGALKNSLAERILRAKGGINVLSFEGEVNALTAMKHGRIDAVLVDAPIALYYASWDPELKLVGQPIGEIEYGIALRKDDTLMLEKVNNALKRLGNDGTLRRVYEEWNLWNHMMAMFLDDKTESNTMPVKYKEYLETKGKQAGIEELVERYLGWMPEIIKAAGMTLVISILSMILAIIVGLWIALTRVYAPSPISLLAVGYIELIRGTPLLIQIYFIFYALPSLGVKIEPVIAGVVSLGLNYAAYEAENYRAGLFSVPKGQMEAAISLGMTRTQALRHVVIPQAVRLVIPPVTNDFISLLKDSSLVSLITIVELTKTYYQISSMYFDFIIPGIIIAVMYLLLGIPFVKLSKWAESKFSKDQPKAKTV